jgi:pimeloyl-ACP methyl ester carboxylesterase
MEQIMNLTADNGTLSYLDRGDGRLAYTVSGDGQLVVTSPAMGDLRQSYRFLSPRLVEAGFRVADADLRGHGDSDTTFAHYSDGDTARDLIALIEHLGGPAVIVGNSMSAGSAAMVAAERPDLVSGIVLIGPFLRDPKANAAALLVMRVLMARPWATTAWAAYLPTLFAGRKPDDFAEYRASVKAAFARPGYGAAFARTTHLSHAEAEASLEGVHTPALVVMGEKDPDFPDQSGEAAWIRDRIGAEVVMVPDAGHYPHQQRPDLVVPAVTAFVERVTGAAGSAGAGADGRTDA